MSILIEDEFIYVAIPKAGCISITNAIIKSNLNYELAPDFKKTYNKFKEEIESKNSRFIIGPNHYRLDQLKNEFGDKKTIAIKRNHLDRFISALKFSYRWFGEKNIKPKIDLNKIDNEYIYKLIDDEFVFLVENGEFVKVLKYFSDDGNFKKKDLEFLFTFIPSSFMKCGYDIDYEFDISELHLLENFLNDRYGSNLEIKKLNVSEPNSNGIVKNTELSDFIWDKFEKKYHNKSLI